MTRKAIIAVLMMAAIGIYSVHFVHYFVPAPIAFFFEDSIHVYTLGRRALNIHIRDRVLPVLPTGWDDRYEKHLDCPWLFRIMRYNDPAPFTRWDVTIYVRPTAAVLVAYPTFVFINYSLRRWRRRRKGLCLKCGYDLTGNESQVCPECGDTR